MPAKSETASKGRSPRASSYRVEETANSRKHGRKISTGDEAPKAHVRAESAVAKHPTSLVRGKPTIGREVARGQPQPIG